MSIFVIGASSQIGLFLLARLRSAQRHVFALSRSLHDETGTDVTWLQGDIQSVAQQAGLEAVVSFGPMEAVAYWLAQHATAPAPVLVATSSMSILTKVSSVDAKERDLVSHLQQGEASLRTECERLGMRWIILRPTLVYGAGIDKSLSPIAQRAMRCRVFPLPSGRGLRQPIHADDLAQIVLKILQMPALTGMTFEVGGGERLTSGEMFRRVRAALPCFTAPFPVPSIALALGAKCIHTLKGPVSRLNQNLIADNTALFDELGFQPRPFRLRPWMLGVGSEWEQRRLSGVGGSADQ